MFGSRCKDGVLLMADKKITTINEFDSISFDYKNKLFGILSGIIFGSSGSTHTFELFRDHIVEQVRKSMEEEARKREREMDRNENKKNENKNEKIITVDNLIIKLCDIVLDLNKKRDFKKEYYFELLVRVRHSDKRSTLTRIMGAGVKKSIQTYETLGIGGLFTKEFLDKLWHPEIKMKEAATPVTKGYLVHQEYVHLFVRVKLDTLEVPIPHQ